MATKAPKIDFTANTHVGLVGLAVMGRNLALNIASHGFPISVYNRSYSKTEDAEAVAKKENLDSKLHGFENMSDFIASIARPRTVIILVKAGAPVDATLAQLEELLEPGDVIIDGGNEWYQNTEKRIKSAKAKGILYMGMGVSGGEMGARYGPSLMPGGEKEAFDIMEPVLKAIADQVAAPPPAPTVEFVGAGGAGNYVKMVHNGIEYGDMQLIAESYDLLKELGEFSNPELSEIYKKWNEEELESFLIEITSKIFAKEDDRGNGFLVDKILDKTGNKGTGKWTTQDAAEIGVAAPTIAAALDMRYTSARKDDRVKASTFYDSMGMNDPNYGHEALKKLWGEKPSRDEIVSSVKDALYASKICSYAQGLKLIQTKSDLEGWDVNLGEMAKIWRGGCIIRARMLGDIMKAYKDNPKTESLLTVPYFAEILMKNSEAWRKVVASAALIGVPVPGMSASLAYFDASRRARLPANLLQAQRDFFGSHLYQRLDDPTGEWIHTEWETQEAMKNE